MTGALIAEYVFSQKAAKGILPKNSALIKTIVTGNISDKIAEHYNAKLIEVLTGFKYIGDRLNYLKKQAPMNLSLVMRKAMDT